MSTVPEFSGVRCTRPEGAPGCSFCHENKEVVTILSSMPGPFQWAHICHECAQLCVALLEPTPKENL